MNRDSAVGAALVTGAGTGIGRAIAIALAETGYRLVVVGRRPELLEQTAATIRDLGGIADARPADVSDSTAVDALMTSLRQNEGRLDVLVHAAGTHALGNVEQASIDDLDELYASNLRGPFLLTRAALPLLREAHGEIVFINSSVVFRPRAGVAAYGATKQGLRAVADSLRAEVNADGVRVLSVYPGRTATPTQEEIHRLEGRPYLAPQLLQPEDVARIVVAAIRLPRTAEVTDVRIRPFTPAS